MADKLSVRPFAKKPQVKISKKTYDEIRFEKNI